VKRECYRHPKLYNLAALLGCSRPEAIGILSLLWDYCGEFAPRGDIGKFPDPTIARACEWSPDRPTEFVLALVDAGFLDTHPEYRLIVHDWPCHCEKYVRARLNRAGLDFLDCYPHREGLSVYAVSAYQQRTDETVRRTAYPIQSNPIQSNGLIDSNRIDRIDRLREIDWEEVRSSAQRIQRKLRLQLTEKNRGLILKACALELYGPMPEAWLSSAVGAVDAKVGCRSKPAYLTTCLKRGAEELGQNFAALMAAVEVPAQLLKPPKPKKEGKLSEPKR